MASLGPLRTDAYSQPGPSPISLEWRLIGNLPDNRYQAEITLKNVGARPLGVAWALYFNSGSRLYPDTLTGEFALTHINGDFFVLRPESSASSIGNGESRTIQWQGGPWAINITDAPSGFYFVPDDKVAEPITIAVPVGIGPFPGPEQLRRGASDAVPVVTPELRYQENESLKLLPPDEIGKLVPTPFEIVSLSGEFVLGASSTIRYDPPLAAEAEFLAAKLEPLVGSRIVTKSNLPAGGDSNSIRLILGEFQIDGQTQRAGDEAYTLLVNPQTGVEIMGSDPAGVFYGVQTLRALLPHVGESLRDSQPRLGETRLRELAIGAVRIADRPRFGYRGVHLDVARNFHPKETVEKLLDLMAFYKLNLLHWHLTDDEGWRIEIRGLPELTEVGACRGHTRDEAEHLIPSLGSGPSADPAASRGSGYYSQDDVVDILRYAHARHIAVIPELDLPGHARAAIKSMEVRRRRLFERGDMAAADEFLLRDPVDKSQYESVQMWRDNVVDVGRESTYRFVSTVAGEIAQMYRRAGVPLASIHLGGDEVPSGVWEMSPSCSKIDLHAASKIPPRGQLELHFLNRASELLTQQSIQPACWEDCLLWELSDNPTAGHTRRAASKPIPTAYVWNNVWGWGREDAAYRLANAGFDVVLCNATHLYFDLACEKDPAEPGYYWAGFVDARAPFELVPLDVFKNAHRDGMGRAVSEADFANRTRLTEEGKEHILGIQGQLWAENLRSDATLEYMAFPRLIALAERAWARSPDWAEIENPAQRQLRLDAAWNQFANRLGQRELPRLDTWCGGVLYRLPPPGAKVQNGHVHVNVAYPGLAIRYSTDGSEPSAASALYTGPIPLAGTVKLKSFDTRGRGSRTVAVARDDAQAAQ
jgi:hexosaminidase